MLLSFDIGIKNLAYCILNYNTEDNSDITIIKWNIIPLLDKNEKCKGFPLDELTKRMYEQLNKEFYSYDIDIVLLENQSVCQKRYLATFQKLIEDFLFEQRHRLLNLILHKAVLKLLKLSNNNAAYL